MYLYFCNYRGCAGHIKSWERCDDLLASPGMQGRLTQGQPAPAPANPARAVEPRPFARFMALGEQEPLCGADITWI